MESTDKQRRSGEWPWVLVIFLTALAVRSIALWLVSDLDFHFEKYPVLAHRLLDNHFLAPEVFAYCPLYLYVLAAMFALFGGTTLPVFLVQILYGSIGSVLAYRILRRLGSRKVAVIGGLLFAFSRSMVLHEVSLLADSLGALLELLLILLLLRALEKPSSARWALCGLVLGLSTTLRPTFALALAGILPGMWFALRSASVRTRLASAGTLVGVTVLTTLPITVQNAVLTEDFVPIVSQGGYVFYTGNNYACSAIRYAPPPLLPAIASAHTHPDEDPALFYDDALSVRIAEGILSTKDMKPSSVSRFYIRRALDPAGRYPGYFAGLFFRKALGIISAYEVHDTLEASAKKKHLSILPLLPYGLIFSLGVLGIIASRARWKELWPLYVLGGTHIVALLVFYVSPRFRLQLEAVLALFAAFAVGWWLEVPRRRSGVFFTALLILLILSFVPRTDVMREVERDQAIQDALSEGSRLVSHGKFSEAIPTVERVAGLIDNPTSPFFRDVHRQLAELYRRTGDSAGFQKALEKSGEMPILEQISTLTGKLNEEGPSPRLLILLAGKYKETGTWNRARDLYSSALALAPEDPRTRYFLAETQLATGDTSGAVLNLQIALQDGLDFSRSGLGAHYHLWKLYQDLDPARAAHHRRSFQSLSWVFQYLSPSPAEIAAMEEMRIATGRERDTATRRQEPTAGTGDRQTRTMN